ncbi:hypothetical protein FHX74_001260 [Friedmanniella endophytica]|uniref:DUF4352 domain-containing protein n=1 Tax=Microlunatus kandeliicorticis TaxID=1759536 RepID=A0A7W3IR32_9ACTN|nr:hypothetical protein [Microlunatus kandeliicorticis]MBA8793655.1 hypothetical protein [Microlunatus kandeliicorticis]
MRAARPAVPARWTRFVGSDRRRSWLITGCVTALVVTYLVIWTLYAGTHTYPRYRQLAAGAASTGNTSFRVTSLVSTEAVRTKYGDVAHPDPGAVFVVAEVTVLLRAPEEDPICGLDLLGPGGRTWETPIGGPTTDQPSDCSDGLVVGRPFSYQQIFEIPATYADQLRGLVVVNHLTGAPSQVIRPAG